MSEYSTEHPWRLPPPEPDRIHDPANTQTCAQYEAIVDGEIDSLIAVLKARDAAIARVREVCREDVWHFYVGEHAGEAPDGGLPFVEVAAVVKALDADR